MPTTETLALYGASLLIFFIILYFVIKSAVSSGIRASGVRFKINYISRLVERYITKNGVEKSEVNEDFHNSLSE